MNRISNIRSVHAYKKLVTFCDFKLLSYISYHDKVGRYPFSTLQNNKTITESRVSTKETVVKLKVEPFEELLKVLEAREHNLQDKSQSKDKASEYDSQIPIILNYQDNETTASEKYFSKPSEKKIDFVSTNGIFSVKSSLKNKKSADVKAKGEEGQKTKASKTKKTKQKLSSRQEYVSQLTRHSNDLRDLKSYLQVMIEADEVEKAQIYLRKQMLLFKKKYQLQNLSDVDLYNLLISGWARKGRIDKVKLIFSLIKEDNLSPNLQSYAGYLEAFSNSKFMHVSEIQKVVDEMKTMGFVPGDILANCVFKGDQREKIFKVLGFLGVDISPFLPEIGEAYFCKLLQHLNDKSFGGSESFPSACYEEKDIDFLASSQLEIENNCSIKIRSIAAITKPNHLTIKSRKYLEECEGVWQKKLMAAVKTFKSREKSCHKQGFHKEESIYPYIATVDNDILVNLLLQQIKVLALTSESFGTYEKFFYKELGRKVMNHYFVWLNKKNQVTDKELLIYKEYLHYFLDPELLSKYSPREYWEYLKSQNPDGPTIDIANVPWPNGALVKIGSELFDILRGTITFDQNRIQRKASKKISMTPAFYITYKFDADMKNPKCIETHNSLCKLYRDANLDLEFDPTSVPMVSPPRPWVKHDSGGLLITPIPFIRFNENAVHQTTFYSTVPSKQLNPCFDSLNSLSNVAFKISEDVLDLIIGNDLIRSVLLFAEGQPLGKNGLNWLKIHLVNLTGHKKRDPHRIRLQYADDNIDKILDSADHPLEGERWWTTSDKPWQTLACCKELANALRHPNPEEYVSHFPIHQDGSCNGLQHYAALGRDELGAIEVNLQPSDAPQDVYSAVAALVEKERLEDAADGVEVAQKLDGFVKRKVVKQTVMTFVYGVTKYGAKQQILKQLKDIPEFDAKYCQGASSYLMEKIFFSIKEMFTATQEIQDWLTDCAEQITKVSGDPLKWVTPLGLPVIQPYHKKKTLKSSKYSLQGKESCLNYTSHYEPYQLPDCRKQKNGFAPNFIHSLDASHMMLTSLFCQRQGITFASVHDCYWTHASTVEIMNKICRQQFVSLHEESILEDLSAFFLDEYARVVDEQMQRKNLEQKTKLRDLINRVPKKGKFNLEGVLESEYFFS
ncbi:DNA-directed RNA polymerase, mitochondrial [Araneus ventricosus]|uniref:DNA-directed RNA polymerase n=1 Tax=Araneus ventricosus TaxID=182803 RepID=A0A4Y2KFV3_ARAVE|nr:DNA-directed RNA polymerase, mitochondrial [Araneus ventricosus]